MDDLKRAIAILLRVKQEYPAIFRAFELDIVVEHLTKVENK